MNDKLCSDTQSYQKDYFPALTRLKKSGLSLQEAADNLSNLRKALNKPKKQDLGELSDHFK